MIRRKTRRTCLILEPTLHDDEDRAAFMARFLRDNAARWREFTPQEWKEISTHILSCDLPETAANWQGMAQRAGFSRTRKLLTTETDFAALYRFDV
jgi:hypothetical protein